MKKNAKKILLITLVFLFICYVLFYILHSVSYIYANINDDMDRITLRSYHIFIVRNKSFYLPIMKTRGLPFYLLGIIRTHYLWTPSEVDKLVKENPELINRINSNWRDRFDGKSIFNCANL